MEEVGGGSGSIASPTESLSASASAPLDLATNGIASVHAVVQIAHRVFIEMRNLSFTEEATNFTDEGAKMAASGASVQPLQELKREYHSHLKKLLQIVQIMQERGWDVSSEPQPPKEQLQSENEDLIAELTAKRDALRKAAYEKNLVIKQVMDKLIDIQRNISIMESSEF